MSRRAHHEKLGKHGKNTAAEIQVPGAHIESVDLGAMKKESSQTPNDYSG